MPNPAILKPKRGTSSALANEPIEDGALLAPTDADSIMLDQGNTRKTIKSGHTMKGPAGAAITQRSTMKFVDATVTDDSTNGETDVQIVRDMTQAEYDALPVANRYGLINITDASEESGGHVIENSSDTDLTQRDTLKFAGVALAASDDSTNEKTIVNADPEPITYAAWSALTPAERDAGFWMITDYPDGSGGGHTIEGADGTALSQEPTLQFADADASDDAVNEKTVVNVVRERTQAEYDDMSAADQAKGIIHISDANAKPLFASQVRYDTNNTVADKLDSLSTSVADTVSKANGGVFGGNVTVDRKDGTASSEGFSHLTLGNATPVGTNQNSTGLINLYSETEYPATLYVNPLTQQRYIGLPDKNGTLALTSDVNWKKLTLNATISSDGLASTFDFSGLRNFHGIAYFYFQNNIGGRFHRLILTSWSLVELGRLSQNNVGTFSESGYIETGDYKVTFTTSTPVTGYYCEVLYFGL